MAREFRANPIMTAPPGIYGERITGDGSMAGSFVVTLRLPARRPNGQMANGQMVK